MKKTKEGLFDWSLYGALLRHQRSNIGFKAAEAFSAALWRRTRVYISRDVLYRLEQGNQIPDRLQFMALNKAAYGTYFPKQVIKQCMCFEWQAVIKDNDPREPDITADWAEENFTDAIKEYGFSEDRDPIEMAFEINEYPGIFEGDDLLRPDHRVYIHRPAPPYPS